MPGKKFLIEFELNISKRNERAQFLSGEKKASPAVKKMNQIKAAGRRRHNAAIARQSALNDAKDDIYMPFMTSGKNHTPISTASSREVIEEENLLIPDFNNKLSIEVGGDAELFQSPQRPGSYQASENRSRLEGRSDTPTSQDRILQKLTPSSHQVDPCPQSRKRPKLRPLSQGPGMTLRLHRIVAQLEKTPISQLSPTHIHTRSPTASSPSSPTHTLNPATSASNTYTNTSLALVSTPSDHPSGTRPISASANKSNSISRPTSVRPSDNRSLLGGFDGVSCKSKVVMNKVAESPPNVTIEGKEEKESHDDDDYGDDFEDSLQINNNDSVSSGKVSAMSSKEMETVCSSCETLKVNYEASTVSVTKGDYPVEPSSKPGHSSPVVAKPTELPRNQTTPTPSQQHVLNISTSSDSSDCPGMSSSFSVMTGQSKSVMNPRSIMTASSSRSAKLICPSFYRSAKGLERDIYRLEQIEAGNITAEEWSRQQRGGEDLPSWDCQFGFGQSALANQEIPKLGHEKRKEQLQQHLDNLRKKKEEREALLETERQVLSTKSAMSKSDRLPAVNSPHLPRSTAEQKKRSNAKLQALLKEENDDECDDIKFF
jgi:hypothetical protein